MVDNNIYERSNEIVGMCGRGRKLGKNAERDNSETRLALLTSFSALVLVIIVLALFLGWFWGLPTLVRTNYQVCTSISFDTI